MNSFWYDGDESYGSLAGNTLNIRTTNSNSRKSLHIEVQILRKHSLINTSPQQNCYEFARQSSLLKLPLRFVSRCTETILFLTEILHAHTHTHTYDGK